MSDCLFFLDLDGQTISIREYFEQNTDPRYRNALDRGRLRFPTLPLVDFSSNPRKPDLVPVEFVVVPGGQSRSRFGNEPQIVQQLIKQVQSSIIASHYDVYFSIEQYLTLANLPLYMIPSRS